MAKKKTKSKKNIRAEQPISSMAYYPEGDARTLAEASAIKANGARFKKAQTASKKLIKEQQAQMDGLKKVLKGL